MDCEVVYNRHLPTRNRFGSVTSVPEASSFPKNSVFFELGSKLSVLWQVKSPRTPIWDSMQPTFGSYDLRVTAKFRSVPR